MTTSIRKRTADDDALLLDIWQRSVETTHTFLNADDICFYLPLVHDALALADVWVAQAPDKSPIAFIGLNGSKVEMLFVDPDRRGQGIGTELLEYARKKRGRLHVNVNEQNHDAHAFYLRRGFKDVGRSELDESGRPFPLIHMSE